MSTSLTAPAAPATPPRRRVLVVRDATPLFLIAAAYLPFLVLAASWLWSIPHYRFFPMVLAGAGLLGWRGARQLGTLEPAPRGQAGRLLAVCWALLALAALLVSRRLGIVAVLVGVPVVADAWGGRRLWRALLPAWTLLLSVVPPPLGLDDRLVVGLRTLASRWSCVLLDALGVYFTPSGNTFEVAGKTLLVEDACSGVHSFFVTVAVTLFFTLWARCSVPRALFLMSAAVGWVILGNVVRIASVAWCYVKLRLDLSTGWRHELLSLLVTAAVFGILASTDAIYRLVASRAGNGESHFEIFGGPWRRPGKGRKRSTQGVVPTTTPDREVAADPLGPTRLPDPRQTALAGRAVVLAFGVLALAELAWVWPSLADDLVERPARFARLRDALTAETLPTHWNSLERVGFKTVARATNDNLGECSKVWSYRSGPITLTASVDFPFSRWHELTQCYQGIGWTLQSRTEGRGDHGPLVIADLTMPGERYGFLGFRLFRTQRGRTRALETPTTTREILGIPLDRLAFWRRHSETGVVDQVQVHLEGPRPLTDADRMLAVSFLELVSGKVHPAEEDSPR